MTRLNGPIMQCIWNLNQDIHWNNYGLTPSPKCQSECHTVKAALCDLGDPGWGDPWFPHWALLLPAPFEVAHGDFVVFPVVFVL